MSCDDGGKREAVKGGDLMTGPLDDCARIIYPDDWRGEWMKAADELESGGFFEAADYLRGYVFMNTEG